MKEQCETDSIILLTELAKKGHKVSKDKLQCCREKAEYLRRTLKGNQRFILPEHVEAIQKLPKPNTVANMSFLGMAGYSRQWICDLYAMWL